MQPRTRLLIQFTLPNGDIKGWGYDYPHYQKTDYLRSCIAADFADGLPENEGIHISYMTHEEDIIADTPESLAQQCVEWLPTTGDYSGY